ncbi:glycine--tRNA ligase subunit beta [Candidatus Profftia tarda]|uniref:Glycine--tRNA ligase beta subunit n=1 Tax=Candidatus Profftia tarda TaxID=1177216 RepID=A0A8E4GHZ2_9ENTR|nr:glycine--tRNA ligase subunit beta [Candidatus Profftia tarda]CAD6512165.1 Glycine--tRNA ligase beta subunit [Candidatus Profftia tarda]
MIQETFLAEIGTEELPPKSLRSLAESFAANFITGLDNAYLAHGEVTWYAAPRRIALKVFSLHLFQPDRKIEKRGPAIAQAFDLEGKPTKSAEAWARSCGITVDHAERSISDKGEWLLFRANRIGYSATQLIPSLVSDALRALPIPKMMRWGNSENQFVRPVHTVTLLLGSNVIPANILGVKSDRVIRGHRFMGSNQFIIKNADQYPQILIDKGKVIADYKIRKEIIRRDAEQAAQKIGGIADINEELLEEVTSLVEWPVVLTAKFEKRFLSIPNEALVCTMQDHQKYFPIYDVLGKLLPHFIFVTNIEPKNPAYIISGNEKVVRSRLVDAEFFFDMDRKKRLEDNLPLLESVIFQQDLGTLRDKTNRLVVLSSWVASQIGADINLANRAGLLAKCDLMTNMVSEFTKIQGIMGMHYARYDSEKEEVAIALREQYWPIYAGAVLPEHPISCSLAIADKIDTITGIFGINQRPKGDKDPFALRRAALGIMQIIVERKLPLDLIILTEKAVNLYGYKLTNINVVDDVVDFMLGRFRSWYHEAGYEIDTIQAVLSCYSNKPAEFEARIKAVAHFRTLPEYTALTIANKRVSKILAKSTEFLEETIQISLLKKAAEIKLADSLIVLSDKLKTLCADGLYQEALSELAKLRVPIDTFFEQVMVLDDDEKIRRNRLTLLSNIRDLFLQVADISVLQ